VKETKSTVRLRQVGLRTSDLSRRTAAKTFLGDLLAVSFGYTSDGQDDELMSFSGSPPV